MGWLAVREEEVGLVEGSRSDSRKAEQCRLGGCFFFFFE